MLKLREALGLLAGGEDDRLVGDAGGGEGAPQRFEMERGDRRVGDDGDARPLQQRGDMRARFGDEAGADQHLIGARAEIDRNGGDVGHGLWSFGSAPASSSA